MADEQCYLGVFLPGQPQATAAALVKLSTQGVMQQGSLSYGSQFQAQHAWRFHPDPALSQPINLLPATRLRDGGALPAYIRDALPDAWGKLVLSAANQFQPLTELQMLCQTNHHRVGALVASEQLSFVFDEQTPLTLAELHDAAMQLQYQHEVPNNVRW